MQRILLAIFCLVTICPLSVQAEDYVSRRDGFLLIWESIRRPAFETRNGGFVDVLEGEHGYTEISYAESRGILDSAPSFRPDDPILLSDALLWLYRTRNVSNLVSMTREEISTMLGWYPLIPMNDSIDRQIESRDELIRLARELDKQLANEEHEASFYADDFHGNGTAFGETFDMHAITAAHRTLPHNTLVKVTNLDNGKSVVVRINDRGPYVDGRNMDLSLGAFEMIAPRGQGILRARFERLGDASLVDTCEEAPRRYQKRITRDVRFHRGIPHTFMLGERLVLGANKYFVVRSITYPDGFVQRIEDWVSKKERYSFTPDRLGEYIFLVGTTNGRRREMRMNVSSCL